MSQSIPADSDLIPDNPTVLVVDDEESVADLHYYRIDEKYDAKIAYGGQQAIERMNTDVDVVLLDRRMPKVSGDEVLERIHEAGYNCQVVMVTAIDPSMEDVKMEFDDYVTKPIGNDTVVEVAEEHLKKKRLTAITNEIFAKESKIEVLEDENPSTELQNHEEYHQVKDELSTLESVKESLEKNLGIKQ